MASGPRPQDEGDFAATPPAFLEAALDEEKTLVRVRSELVGLLQRLQVEETVLRRIVDDPEPLMHFPRLSYLLPSDALSPLSGEAMAATMEKGPLLRPLKLDISASSEVYQARRAAAARQAAAARALSMLRSYDLQVSEDREANAQYDPMAVGSDEEPTEEVRSIMTSVLDDVLGADETID